MNTNRSSWRFGSKYVSTINKLFQGLTPVQITPNQDEKSFWHDLLSLDPDRDFLVSMLTALRKEDCLHTYKSAFNTLFTVCVAHARDCEDNIVRVHAVDTLAVVVRCVLAKNLAGWEVMEIFAGGVNESDQVFMTYVAMIADVMGDEATPANLRHQVLQLAVIFACGINQLSPGAYLLRRDLFPSIAGLVKSPDTERFSFEAMLLLSILANFHKSDSARLNPYLQSIRDSKDTDLMTKMCWAANYAADAAIKAYQEISDDSIPTLGKSLGSLVTSLWPDRALAKEPVDPPRELFKHQPIEATVAILPIFEFLFFNQLFPQVLVESISHTEEKTQNGRLPPLPFTILTLSSYLMTHASSSSSPRAIAYANLSMSILLVMAENTLVMKSLCQPSREGIRICRQRLPVLPIPSSSRPPICALLDCCVLWLRHNLHKRLEVHTYTTCMWVCNRVIWYLQRERIRLEYEWAELWSAILGLLGFLSSKLDNLTTTGGVERLVQETVRLLDFILCKVEIFLPTPRHIHEFIYELVRSSPILRKQQLLLEALGQPLALSDRRVSFRSDSTTKALSRLFSVVGFYENLIATAGVQTAKEAIRVVAKDIEKDGLHGLTDVQAIDDPPIRSEDVVGFIRYACVDGLSLMP
ncbi:hypothetical protein BV22DRAFT_1032014 [Leucogyrophana mollusca]|uniref:Uncharacterized protein n=1 Tax=Leucogyrophana mollusca TaxID=85980 RepID=A0ACB8BNQ2_9AGAM|nr:hypothetical protein BV22DRAFT_1032014 [Leucogyrophana mollusca]